MAAGRLFGFAFRRYLRQTPPSGLLALHVWDRIHWPVDRAAVGDGAFVRLADDGAVLFEQAAEAMRWRTAVGGGAGSQLSLAQSEMDRANARRRVDFDDVAIAHERDRPTDACLGAGIADTHAAGAPEKRPSV